MTKTPECPPKKKTFWQKLGPGFITGASDDDPSGIATYAQTGALFGYTQLWTALFSFPLMTAIQEMCGRIGIVTGKGLAGVIKKNYSKPVLYGAVTLLLCANIINIGADLGAMAAAMQLLVDLPFSLLVIATTLFTVCLQVFVPYHRYAQFLKYLALSLFAYVVTVFVVKQDWSAVALHTFVPHISSDPHYIMNIVALLGTTISPYLFFWQTGEEVEEQIACGKMKTMGCGTPTLDGDDIANMRIDTAVGMFFSNIVMFFIIVTTASTLGAAGITNIASAAEAANALRPFAGDFAFLLFALGIVGTGLLAVPVLAGSAAYAVAETCGWKESLGLKWWQAKGFYAVIALATVAGLLLNFIGIPPFRALYYTAVLNGLAAPPLLFLILRIANNKKIMGTHTNGRVSNVLGWMTTLVMTGAGVALVITMRGL